MGGIYLAYLIPTARKYATYFFISNIRTVSPIAMWSHKRRVEIRSGGGAANDARSYSIIPAVFSNIPEYLGRGSYDYEWGELGPLKPLPG